MATKVITTFLALILTLNNFILNKQKAVLWEPSVHHHAPIYLWIILKKKLMYPFIKGFSLIYLRFIDLMFFIWTGKKKDLLKFLNELNTKHESIKLEYQISKTNITFLDTKYTQRITNYIKKYKENRQIIKHSSISTLRTLNLGRPVFRIGIS